MYVNTLQVHVHFIIGEKTNEIARIQMHNNNTMSFGQFSTVNVLL